MKVNNNLVYENTKKNSDECENNCALASSSSDNIFGYHYNKIISLRKFTFLLSIYKKV